MTPSPGTSCPSECQPPCSTGQTTHQIGRVRRPLDEHLHEVARRDLLLVALLPELLLDRVQRVLREHPQVDARLDIVLPRRLAFLAGP